MDQYDYVRRAIDVMTAWATDDPDGGTFTKERLREYISEEPDGEGKLMIGLVSLSGYLLTRLEGETGKPMQSHLQEIARKIADK